MLQPYIDRPHQLRNTIVRCRIMKYRIYLLRKSFFQLHCRFSACCDSESNHSVLGHRKNVAEELHGMDSVTGWLPVWRSALTRMKLGRITGIQLQTSLWVLSSSLLLLCFAADLPQGHWKILWNAMWLSFGAEFLRCVEPLLPWSSLTSHSRCPTGQQSNWHKQSSHWIAFFLQVCLKDHRNHLPQKI